jgi:hypothetical protein
MEAQGRRLIHFLSRGSNRSWRIRVHLRWVSWWIRRLLVVTGARCPL